MTLNDITLSPSVVAHLYPRHLVEAAPQTEPIETETERKPTTTSTRSELKYLGNNLKQVLVAVNYANSTHLPDEQLSYLTKILSSCELGLNDIALVNLHNFNAEAYRSLVQQFNSKVILLFGITTESFGLPFAIPAFQVQGFEKSVVIQVPALEEIPGNPTSRQRLWEALKTIFNIGK